MDLVIVLSLMLLGIILFILEMFLIPGVTVAAVAGGVAVTTSIIYAYKMGSFVGTLTLVFGLVAMTVFIWLIARSRFLDRMSLKTTIEGKVDVFKELAIKEGDEGVTISRLAPMGKVKVNGLVVEAKTEGGFVDENTPVVVVKVFKTNILVRIVD
jgi:membrane-bound ClpP family serine protease